MKSNTFNFHETFPMQLVYVSEILKLASESYVGSKEAISDRTSIPTGKSTGKVEPHIKYAAFAGLIEFKRDSGEYSLQLTPLGKAVYENDPYLLSDVTKHVMHYNLTSKNGAPQWHFVFRKLSYEFYNAISWSSIESRGKDLYGADIKVGPIRSLYGKEGDFNGVTSTDINKESITFEPAYVEYDKINCYAYTLLNEWEQEGLETEIEISKITHELKWGKAHGLDSEGELEVLEELAANGWIQLNKQMNPITVINKVKSEDVLMELYNE